ncbi:MAG: class I SAM-dependent methyltransferase [Gemmatimonadota bacterium]
MNDPRQFYDQLAELYHLIFEDWDRSIVRQGDALERVIQCWPGPNRLVLDVAAGIGTQTLGLAQRGFTVIGSDISTRALARARRESQHRQLHTNLVAADLEGIELETTYFAVSIDEVLGLMSAVGLTDVQRLDDVFYQPYWLARSNGCPEVVLG